MRILYFDASVDQVTELKIENKRQIYAGIVKILESEPVDIFGEIRYLEAYECEGRNYQHSFQVTAMMPPSTFQYLLNYDEDRMQAIIGLEFRFPGGSFSFGFAPDGSMIDWDIEKGHVERAVEVRVAILSKNKSQSC